MMNRGQGTTVLPKGHPVGTSLSQLISHTCTGSLMPIEGKAVSVLDSVHLETPSLSLIISHCRRIPGD